MRAVHAYGALFLIASVYVGIQATLPHTAFLSIDGGQKLVLVKAIHSNPPFDFSLPYDRPGVEPEGAFRFAPFFPSYAFVHEGKMFSIVPFYFPLVCSPFYALFGHAGLFILPLVSAALSIWFLIRICHRSLPSGSSLLAAVAAGLASSVFFYALTFWEHTVSVCLATGSLALLYSGRNDPNRFSPKMCLAGALLAVGAWMRTDVLFLAVGLGVALLLRDRHRRLVVPLAAGLLTGLVPFVVCNQIIYNAPFGPQIALGARYLTASGSLGGILQSRWAVARYLFLAYADHPMLDFVFVLISLFPAVYFSRIRKWDRRHELTLLLWTASLSLVILITLSLLLSTPKLLRTSMLVVGLFVALPILPIALARPREATPGPDGDFYAVLSTAVLNALAMACLLLADPGGLQWGPRYALVLFPPLILLAVRGITGLQRVFSTHARRRIFVILVASVLAAGTSVQVLGVSLPRSKRVAAALNNETIRKVRPPVIITDTWWFPQDGGDLMHDIPVYQVRRGEGEDELLDGLHRVGLDRALLVTTSNLRSAISRSDRMKLVYFGRTQHPRTPTLNLYLHLVQLTTPMQKP